MTDMQAVLDDIHSQMRSEQVVGNVATYIPQLSLVPASKFGMALRDTDGQVFSVGDSEEPFSIQSVSKVFTLAMALRVHGDELWERVGRESSGGPFNSLVQLETELGVPRNPFINAGALVVTDALYQANSDAKESVLALARDLSGNPHASFDQQVADSERDNGHRNLAMVHFMKSFGTIAGDVEPVIDAYFHHCSISMSCVDLATAFTFLANEGLDKDGNQILDPSLTKKVNALMLTCGTYDAAGDFAYRVGLPCKSGVGGGIVAAMPGEFSVCVWAPGLDENGNSLLGMQALELLTTAIGTSIF